MRNRPPCVVFHDQGKVVLLVDHAVEHRDVGMAQQTHDVCLVMHHAFGALRQVCLYWQDPTRTFETVAADPPAAIWTSCPRNVRARPTSRPNP
eukprot:scaffold611_cov367-Pavlova_lutheri.AAC.3